VCRGAGKTTVVAPLLALMLADGKRLVAQVVPQALLDFSRGVTRERFSAVVRKSVYTFTFDRFCTVDSALHRKLLKAAESRAVLVCTSTSLKAFELKFVELLNNIDQLHTTTAIEIETAKAKGKSKEVKRLRDAFASQAATLREQIELAVRILRLFRTSSLLLDEVDMILHPLKSELNYPVRS